MCGALPKACHGHPIALHPVPDPPTVQVLLRALKDRLPLNTVTDSDFLFSTSVAPDVLSKQVKALNKKSGKLNSISYYSHVLHVRF